MSIPYFPVVIIGAGPGGLALAQGLRKQGIAFRIFERAPARDDYVQGFRLRVRQRGLDALEQLLTPDLHQAFIDTIGHAPPEGAQIDEQLNEVGPPRLSEEEDVHAEKSVSRITLRQVLLSGLEDHLTYAEFDHYEEEGDLIRIHLRDGGQVTAGVLVGADGAGSKVRAQLSPEAKHIDTGIRRIAGKITFREARAKGLLPLFFERTVQVKPNFGRSLMISAHRVDPSAFARHGLIGQDDPSHKGIAGFHFNNTTSYLWWNTAYRQDEIGSDAEIFALDGEGLRERVLLRMEGWHPALRDLIRYSDPSTIGLLRVRSSVPGNRWPLGRVTLLGDASHAMTYFRALGGNSAIYDAGHLSRALGDWHFGRAPLAEVMATYEAELRRHGDEAVTTSLEAMLRTIPEGQPLSAAA